MSREPVISIADESSTKKPRAFASSGLVLLLAGAMWLLGVLAAVGGVAYAVNGATQAKAYVTVPVQARAPAGLSVPTTARGDSASQVPLRPDAGNKIRLDISGTERSNWLQVGTDSLTLRSFDSTFAEQLLSRADVAVLGLSIGAGALLLRRLLLSIAEGEPFRPGNAARVAGIAGLTAGGSLAAAFSPALGAGLVLERLGLDGAGSPVTTTFSLPVVPLLVALLLLALAETFRRGTELAQDVDGLV
ncbi:DUF2975 domain-containing protein [Streptomyces sp. NPDC005408]|uniref:DUF2975 domain-containing protein n=1 Tax=Streptomyces sp. NPDC005408 TaxID=3155341 RepID=UPI0033AC53A8